MKRVLSGIQPSGELHLGNYFGMMSRMIKYQNENDLFCFIVNYHALTTIHDKELMMKNTMNAAIDFMSLGLDPKKSTFWVQSDVPQVCESTWLLSNLVNLGLLDRSTAYKDKLAKGLTANLGLYSYPVLMASDILLFGGEIVPVGQDQKQHIEITRDIANRFNNIFGETFVVPEADIEKTSKLIPGIDGQKMSKSYANTIPIFADEKLIKKSVMSITTDSAGINEPKDKDSPLFKIYSLFLNSEEKNILSDRYDTPGLKYGDLKKELLSKIIEYFSPYREKREYLSKNIDQVHSLLYLGRDKASKVADEYIKKIRDAMGLNY